MGDPRKLNGALTSPPATCYAYAIVLLDTLAIKKFQNREDLKGALNDIGDRPKMILKWHEGAKQWTQPETYA